MTKVNFFSVEVKYTGNFEDYNKGDFESNAFTRIDRGYDAYDGTKEIPDDEAKAIDGIVEVINEYPCNKLARVKWAEIAENEEEDN